MRWKINISFSLFETHGHKLFEFQPDHLGDRIRIFHNIWL